MFGAMVAALAVAIIASLLLGSNPISPAKVIAALRDPAADADNIVWGSRIPRTVLGLFVGACLGIAGTVMQGQTRNPLADPGIFGVSAGSSLAVVIGIYAFHSQATQSLVWYAFTGAIVASVLVFGLASMGNSLASPVPMAIAGTAVTALFSAFTSFIVLRDEQSLAGYRIWVVGSVSGRTLDGMGTVMVFAVIGLACAVLNIRSLNVLALGSDLARGLGQNLLAARLVGLGAITLLTAAAVALTGPIGFVGLTAPHMARAMVGADHRRLVPASGMLGAFVLLGADILGRLVGGSNEIQVGVVLSVIGGIAFVVIVRKFRMVAL